MVFVNEALNLYNSNFLKFDDIFRGTNCGYNPNVVVQVWWQTDPTNFYQIKILSCLLDCYVGQCSFECYIVLYCISLWKDLNNCSQITINYMTIKMYECYSILYSVQRSIKTLVNTPTQQIDGDWGTFMLLYYIQLFI